MNKQRKTILWLVSWYPNKWDAFDGDFIQRHARAAAIHHNIYVLFVRQSFNQKTIEWTHQSKDGLTEEIIYLPKQKGTLGKLHSYRQWLKQYKTEIAAVMKEHRPALIHVHVPWKVGLLAVWAKKKYRLPYIVTEHWGIYNTVVEDNIYTWPFWRRRLLKNIFHHARHLVSVSRYLAREMNRFIHKESTILPNVVDDSLFIPSIDKFPVFTFLHVSNMVPLKNVEGILKAFRKAKKGGLEGQLLMVGNKDEKYVRLADDLDLSSSISFLGEISYAAVAAVMRKSHVLVVNSNIENSPCVIGEALCCGLPVIATAVGGIPELIDEGNGLLISPGNDEGLAGAMLWMLKNHAFFTAGQIAVGANKRFSILSLGVAFDALYQQLTKKTGS